MTEDSRKVEGFVDDTEDYHVASESVSCCSRLRSELCSAPFFGLKEPTGEIIHVEATFAPRPVAKTLFFRILFFGITVGTMAYDIYRTPKENRYIYLGYLTRWTLVMAQIYQLIAIVCTQFRKTLKQPEDDEEQRPRFLVRFMWALYSLVAPAYLIVTLLYWTLDYQPGKDEISLRNILLHGGIAMFIWADGLVISVIPVRMKQSLFLISFAIIYIVWTVIHDYSDIGDGDWSNEDDTDPKEDSLYEVLSWSNDARGAGILTAIVICVICPFTFMVFWWLSLWSRWCRLDGSRRRTLGGAHDTDSSEHFSRHSGSEKDVLPEWEEREFPDVVVH